MKMLPVVTRELGAIARRRSAYWIRTGAAMAAFIAMLYVALIGASRVPLLDQGRTLLEILGYSAFVYALAAGIRGTSDALSEEKREGTLGLLFLTDLKGYDVVFGKFVSLSINSFYGIFAIVPALALAFLLGGTSPMQFLMISVALVNTLFFSLAVGIVVSTFSHNERAAMGVTLATIFVSAAGGYLLAVAHAYDGIDLWNAFLPSFLLTSPIFAFRTAIDPGLSIVLAEDFWISSAFTFMSGWLCLIVASACIAGRAHQEAPKSRIGQWIVRVRQRWAYGRAQHRTAIRRRLLDRNAFFWLAGRDRLKGRYAWTFITLLAIIWGFARWRTPEIMSDWSVVLVALWILHFFFKVWMSSEVAARFIEDRRSNALELLLTTPLGLHDVAAGQRLALWRQFGGPLVVVLFLNIIAAYQARGEFGFVFTTSASAPYFTLGLIHLFADLYAIHWVSIWRSSHLRGANRTILQTIGLVVFMPVFGLVLLWQGSWILAVLTGSSMPTGPQLLWRWTILCVIYDGVIALIARRSFYRGFRDAATRNFDKPEPSRLLFWRKRAHQAAPISIPIPVPVRVARPQRWARRLALAGITVLIGIVIFAKLRRDRLTNEVNQRFAAIRAQGMPVTPSEIAMWRPAPVAGEDATELLRSATVAFSWAKAGTFSKAYEGSRDRVARDIPADLRSNVVVFVRKNERAFKLLEELATKKTARPSVDPNARIYFGAEGLMEAFQFKGLLELEDDPPAAGKTISTLLHYVRLREGPGAVGSGRFALQIATALMERGAHRGVFPASAWQEWKGILEQIDFAEKLEIFQIWQRTESLEMLEQTPDVLYQAFGRQLAGFPALFNLSWGVRTFLGQDKAEALLVLDFYEQGLAATKKPYPEMAQWQRPYDLRPPSLASAYVIAPHLLPPFDSMYHTATAAKAQQVVMLAAIEVELFRAAQGRLPAQVSELTKPLGLDPFSLRPLTFKLVGGGYTVESAPETTDISRGARMRRLRYEGASFHSGPLPERETRRR